MLGTVFYLFILFLPLFHWMSIISLGTAFIYFYLSLRKNPQTISKCQEDKNVTQETKQKLINHSHVHMKYKTRYM